MISYTAAGRRGPRKVLLFGNGLIGSAIDGALRGQRRWEARTVAWRWTDRAQRAAAAMDLFEGVDQSERVDLIWAAGVSGFGSSDHEMSQETDHVAEVAKLAVQLTHRSDHVAFHLFSSLGGLYEGQCAIERESVANPRRPYGRAKLCQESLIKNIGHGIIPRIYRPSSVYGIAQHGRRGLFAAIAAAIVQQKPLTIYGSANTLRDYVFAQDIGTYIAHTLAADTIAPATEVLASGKPTSVAEAIFAMETQFGRRLYCRFDSAPHNSLDMTVRMSALPQNLPRTALPIGIASVFFNVSRSLAA